MGTGNQIDYFVAETRTYSGPKSQVRAFYQKQTLWNPLNGKATVPIVVFGDEVSYNNANDEGSSLAWA